MLIVKGILKNTQITLIPCLTFMPKTYGTILGRVMFLLFMKFSEMNPKET